MGAFEDSKEIESLGMVKLMPYLDSISDHGRVVRIAKGSLERHLQETIGDIIMNHRNGRMYAVELKTERRFTGNLFIEAFSNKGFRRSGSGPRINMGWAYKSFADFLLTYFLDTDLLVSVPMEKLQLWAFEAERGEGLTGRVFDYKERAVRSPQLNHTTGWPVPIDVLRREVGVSECYVSQLKLPGLFEDLA